MFDLTRVQYAIARRFEAAENNVHWMTTNPLWTKWLQAQGVDDSRIVELVYESKDYLSDKEKRDLLEEIVKTEELTDISINQSILSDKFVMARKRANLNDYACLYYRDIKLFLMSRQIDCVFAEPSNLNELITHMLCCELNIPLYAAQSLRYPEGRFFIGRGVFYDDMVSVNSSQPDVSPDSGRELIDDFIRTQSRPAYFHINNGQGSVNVKRIGDMATNRMKSLIEGPNRHLTHHHFTDRLSTLVSTQVNSLYLNYFCRYDKLDDITGRIAFYGLHVQPESSIDVVGPYVSDQLKLIKDIRRSLPFDTTLVIKEHPNLLGMKPISFFKAIKQIPNVALVAHSVSTFEIYKRASLVLTVSGTTAFEAGLLGILAVTFSPMYFSGLSSVHYCKDITMLKPLLFRILADFKRDIDADSMFMDRMIRDSFAGYWTDPLTDIWVMAPENIDNLYAAFAAVAEHDTFQHA